MLTRMHGYPRYFVPLLKSGSSDTKTKLWMKAETGQATKKRRKLLPSNYVRIFERRQLLCMEFTKLTSQQEREIFQVSPFLSTQIFAHAFI
jgi:hypothetical protein